MREPRDPLLKVVYNCVIHSKHSITEAFVVNIRKAYYRLLNSWLTPFLTKSAQRLRVDEPGVHIPR